MLDPLASPLQVGQADAVADKFWVVWNALNFDPVHAARGWEYSSQMAHCMLTER
jgi:hypothetical protein